LNYAKIEQLITEYREGQPVEQELYGQLNKLFYLYQRIKPFYTAKSEFEDMKITFITRCFEAIPRYNPEISNIKSYFFMLYKRNYVGEIIYQQVPKRDYRKESFSLDDTFTDDEESGIFADHLQTEESFDLNPLMMLEKQEEARELRKKMSAILTDIERDCLIAAYVEGQSYSEIAEQLGVPEKSVDNAIQRGKGKLNKTVDKKGFYSVF